MFFYHVGYVVVVDLLVDVALHEGTAVVFLDVALPSFGGHLDGLGESLLFEVPWDLEKKENFYRWHSCRRK